MGEAQDCCQSGTQCPSGKMCGLAVVGHDGGVAMMNLLPPAPLGAGVVGGGGLVSTCQ